MGQTVCTGRRDEDDRLDTKKVFEYSDRFLKKNNRSPMLRKQIIRAQRKLDLAVSTYSDYKEQKAARIGCHSCTRAQSYHTKS